MRTLTEQDVLLPYLFLFGGENVPFNNFNGEQSPLTDRRLTKSDTTPAGAQQYRILRDSQMILVPRGQSITKPHANENVSVNFGIHGSIREGWFQAPVAEFRNTTNYDLFDRFNLTVRRDEILDDGTELDLYDTSLFEVLTVLQVEFEDYVWIIPQQIRMYRAMPNVYFSDNHFYTTANQVIHMGEQEFTLEFDGKYYINHRGYNSYHVGDFNSDNDSLYFEVNKMRIRSGASEYIYNHDFYNLNIPEIKITGYDTIIVKGWT